MKRLALTLALSTLAGTASAVESTIKLPVETNVTAGNQFVTTVYVDPDTSTIGFVQFTFEWHNAYVQFDSATVHSDMPVNWAIQVSGDPNGQPGGPGTNSHWVIQSAGQGLDRDDDAFWGDYDHGVVDLHWTAQSEGTSPLIFDTHPCNPTHLSTFYLQAYCPPDDLGHVDGEINVAAASKCPPDCEELKPEPDSPSWSLIKRLFK